MVLFNGNASSFAEFNFDLMTTLRKCSLILCNVTSLLKLGDRQFYPIMSSVRCLSEIFPLGFMLMI